MDDSSVSQVSVQTVLKQQAYLLFYLQTNLSSPNSSSTSTSTATLKPKPNSITVNGQHNHSTSSEIDSTLQKRKFNELSSSSTEQPKTLVYQNGSFNVKDMNGNKKKVNGDDDEDEDDDVGDLLYLAKKNQINLPIPQSPSTPSKNDISSTSLPPSPQQEPPKPCRLPVKRFGIFR